MSCPDIEPDRDLVPMFSDDPSAPLGILRAAVPMLIRRHPVARAASRVSLSRMPRTVSSMSRLPNDAGEGARDCSTPERGIQVNEVHPRRALFLPVERSLERVPVRGFRSCFALNETDVFGHLERRRQAEVPESHVRPYSAAPSTLTRLLRARLGQGT